MNKQECDILNKLLNDPHTNQRKLSERSGHSLGVVNQCIKSLSREGYVAYSDGRLIPTEKAREARAARSPKNAIILAAGFGMRMIPINSETPKALLEVNGEPLVERVIKQLHAAGIEEIYIVVGFMKERFEYLIDKFGAELIVNSEYSRKNNLHSLRTALKHLSNSYIIPCDVWCAENPFSACELYSWYMVSSAPDSDSPVRVNRRAELVRTPRGSDGNTMIGIAYLEGDTAAAVRDRITAMCSDSRCDKEFWEAALYREGRMIVNARVADPEKFVEINTYEQLRDLDGGSSQLRSDKIAVIAWRLNVDSSEIRDIAVLKKGMTNRSFVFSCRGEKYIMRIPGEGTDKLIDRREEARVLNVVNGSGCCEDIVYIDPANGFKISKFIDNARCCDPYDPNDVRRCMEKLRSFHETGLAVPHEFDIFGHILFYEELRGGAPSVYGDYELTKENVFGLRSYIEAHAVKKVLAHIDAVPDNFLFCPDGHGGEDIRLIDWEYAAMQDPHVDVAMFGIYSMYDKEHIDSLIDCYFTEGCPKETRVKIYCYVAACGLLWSNWCEYKQQLGVEFGEYSLRQYRYAKEYYRIARGELDEQG